jgi:hypothetical protein
MHVIIIVLLPLTFLLAPIFGLLNVLEDLVDRHCQGEPVFHEPGAIFHDQGSELRSRSQFAWQSRSHFREPD